MLAPSPSSHLPWEQPVCLQLTEVQLDSGSITGHAVTFQYHCCVIQRTTLYLTHNTTNKVALFLQTPQNKSVGVLDAVHRLMRIMVGSSHVSTTADNSLRMNEACQLLPGKLITHAPALERPQVQPPGPWVCCLLLHALLLVLLLMHCQATSSMLLSCY